MDNASGIPIEQLWSDADFEPNNKQKEAIPLWKGAISSICRTGSGKTQVLLWQNLDLMVFCKIKPEEIFTTLT